MPTLREQLQKARDAGFSDDEIRERFSKIGFIRSDVDLEYGEALQKAKTRKIAKSAQAAIPFADITTPLTQQEEERVAIAKLQVPEIPKQVIPEAAPAPEPKVPDAGQSILAGGKTPETGGEYQFQAQQLLRPIGFAAGVAAETGRLGTELGVQTYGLATGRDPGAIRKKLGKQLGLSPAETRQALEPQASKALADRYLGLDPDEELKQKDKDLYQKIQEDAEEVLAGFIIGTLTDIIPILPSKTSTTAVEEIFDAAERGTQLPGFTAAGPAIFMKSISQLAEGDVAGAAATLVEKPVTLVLTVKPFAKAAGIKVPKVVSDRVAAAQEAIGERVPARWKQVVGDPLAQETRARSARAEEIYEEARATRQKTKEALGEIVAEAGEARPAGEGVILKTGETVTKLKPQIRTERAGELLLENVVKDEKFNKFVELSKEQENLNEKPLTKEEAVEATQKLIDGAPAEDYATSPESIKTLEELTQELKDLKKQKEDSIRAEDGKLSKRDKAEWEALDREIETYIDEEIVPREELLDELLQDPETNARRIATTEADLRGLNNMVKGMRDLQEQIVENANQTYIPDTQRRIAAQFDKKIETTRARLEDTVSKEKQNLQKKQDKLSSQQDQITNQVVPRLAKQASKEVPEIGLTPEEAAQTRGRPRATFGAEGLVYQEQVPGQVETIPVEGQRGVKREVSPLVERPLGKETLDEIEQNFADRDYAIGREPQPLSPEIRTLVAQGAADILEENPAALLRSGENRMAFAKHLANKYAINKSRSAKAALANYLDQILRPDKNGRSPNELKAVKNLGADFSPEQLRNELIDYFGRGKPEVLQSEIGSIVQAEVANKAFKQSLKENIIEDSAGQNLSEGATAIDIANDFVQRADGGIAPFSIKAGGNDLQAIVEALDPATNPNYVKLVQHYVRPSPELARLIGQDYFVSPSFNSSMTSVLKSLNQLRNAELGFNALLGMAKKAFTSRNLASARNNFKSNIILYNVIYGALEGIPATLGAVKPFFQQVFGIKGSALDAISTETGKIVNRYLESKPANKKEAILFRSLREAGLIDNTNIAFESNILNKRDPISAFFGMFSRRAEGVIRKINAGLDATYTFGDNYFKGLSAINEAGFVIDSVNVLKPGESLTVKLGQYKDITIRKTAQGGLELVDGKRVKPITEEQMISIAGKSGARIAFDRFVDYERVPGYLAWIRRGAGGAGGLVSLFFTWQYKMMDIPGFKKGVVSSMFEDSPIIKTDSSAVRQRLTNLAVSRGMGKTATAAIAQSAIDQEQDGDVRRMVSFDKTGMAMGTYAISEIDPFAIAYKDESAANFLGPTERATRVLMAGGLAAYNTLKDNLSVVIGEDAVQEPKKIIAYEDKEQSKLAKGVRDISMKMKAGRLVTAKDVMLTAGFAGNPLFDAIDLVLSSDNNPNIDPVKVLGKLAASTILGGTLKDIVAASLVGLTNVEDRFSPGTGMGNILFPQVYRNASSAPYISMPIERQRNMVRELVNTVFGTAYRYSFAYKMIDGREIGTAKRFIDDYAKKLKKSLAGAHKQRLKAMDLAGIDPNSKAYKIEEERFIMASEAVDAEAAAFKQRINNAIDKTSMFK